MTEPRTERCETCRFWDDSDASIEGGFGRCRRSPPVLGEDVSPDASLGRWPLTEVGNWCGEWQAQMEAEQARCPTNAVALVQNLDADAIWKRLDELEEESKALRVLLRSVRSTKRDRSKRQQS